MCQFTSQLLEFFCGAIACESYREAAAEECKIFRSSILHSLWGQTLGQREAAAEDGIAVGGGGAFLGPLYAPQHGRCEDKRPLRRAFADQRGGALQVQ